MVQTFEMINRGSTESMPAGFYASGDDGYDGCKGRPPQPPKHGVWDYDNSYIKILPEREAELTAALRETLGLQKAGCEALDVDEVGTFGCY